jgi:predicted ester cyclase
VYQAGKGIENHMLEEPYISSTCAFESKAFPEFKTFQDHIQYIHDLKHGSFPDLTHVVKSVTSNSSQVTIVGVIEGTLKADTHEERKVNSDYAITFTVNEEGKIVHVYHVFDRYLFNKQLNWKKESLA